MTKATLEARARELCIAAGSKPDEQVKSVIRKDDRGMPVSKFVPRWELYINKAEKELENHVV